MTYILFQSRLLLNRWNLSSPKSESSIIVVSLQLAVFVLCFIVIAFACLSSVSKEEQFQEDRAYSTSCVDLSLLRLSWLPCMLWQKKKKKSYRACLWAAITITFEMSILFYFIYASFCVLSNSIYVLFPCVETRETCYAVHHGRHLMCVAIGACASCKFVSLWVNCSLKSDEFWKKLIPSSSFMPVWLDGIGRVKSGSGSGTHHFWVWYGWSGFDFHFHYIKIIEVSFMARPLKLRWSEIMRPITIQIFNSFSKTKQNRNCRFIHTPNLIHVQKRERSTHEHSCIYHFQRQKNTNASHKHSEVLF